MDNLTSIEVIIEELRLKLNLPELRKWNNSIFEQLSEEIHKSTGILLSRNTLKNIIGKIIEKDKSYSPQLATKNALALFLGYNDWKDYQLKKNISIDSQKFIKPIHSSLKLFGISIRKIGFISGIFLLLFIAIIFTINKSETNSKKLSFTISDSLGKAPHTITMNYDLSTLTKKDSVFIDLDTYTATGKYELKHLQNIKGITNFCYYLPGYYHTALYLNNKKIRSKNILIESNGWQAIVRDANYPRTPLPILLNDKKWIPIYTNFDNIITSTFITDGKMSVNSEQAFKVVGLPKNYHTEFINYQKMNIDGDNCTLSVCFSNNDFGKENYCYSAEFALIGTNGNLRFRIMQPGCKLYSSYEFSEVKKMAIENIIEDFEYDFSTPRVVQMTNNNKNIELSIDSKTFHKNQYTTSIGQLVGIELIFKGAAEVDWVEIKDIYGNSVFRDDF